MAQWVLETVYLHQQHFLFFHPNNSYKCPWGLYYIIFFGHVWNLNEVIKNKHPYEIQAEIKKLGEEKTRPVGHLYGFFFQRPRKFSSP